jgi:hypothetical protein
MPRRLTQTKHGTHKALKNTSFEIVVLSWLMQDGWQVFMPVLDHGHNTDLLISDGPNYFRIQVKTIDSSRVEIRNQWEGSNVDVVIYFSRNSNWGYITPAFEEKKRVLEHPTHRKFNQNKKDFLKQFHQL